MTGIPLGDQKETIEIAIIEVTDRNILGSHSLDLSIFGARSTSCSGFSALPEVA